MGKKIAILHTVPSVYNSFPDLIRVAMPEVILYNTVDEFLPMDFQTHKGMTPNNLTRLHDLIRVAGMTGADAIVVTCSTMSPAVKMLRPMFATPVIPVDGPMLDEAIRLGSRITIIGTAHSAVDPGEEFMRTEGEKLGRTMDVQAIALDSPAFVIAAKNDMAARDKAILETACALRNRDVIVLAQASMAHLEERIAKATGIQTLSSPRLCLAELRRILGM